MQTHSDVKLVFKQMQPIHLFELSRVHVIEDNIVNKCTLA